MFCVIIKSLQIFWTRFEHIYKSMFCGIIRFLWIFWKARLQFQLEGATLPNSFSSFVRKGKILHSVNFIAFSIRAFSAKRVNEHE